MIAALRDGDCRYEGGPGSDDERFARRLSPYLGLPPEVLLDRDQPHYSAIDDAIERITERGDMVVDQDNRIVTLTDCP